MLVDLFHMIGFIIGLPSLPQFPNDAKPAIGQAAIGVAIGHTTSQTLAEVGCRPLSLKGRRLGKLLSGVTMVAVASLAEVNASPLATLVSDRTGTGQ